MSTGDTTTGESGDWELVVDGIDFGEGPRWHLGRLWFSDFYQGTISSVGHDRQRRVEVEYDGRASGLGWLPDGRLLFVSMLDRRVMRREDDGTIVEHADLDGIATGHCNDMVVGPQGNAYVGNFGFDFEGGDPPAPATLAIVWADGTVTAAADDLLFPNGSVITDDGTTLIVGESMGARYTAFTITHDRGLTDRRVWADVPGMAPDGCTIDAEQGIWFADALGKQVVRVVEGGEITHRIATSDSVFACMLGGAQARTLFALTAAGSHPDVVAGSASGALWQIEVDVPRTATSRP
jgi:sugar lactone lactonase YvrE